MNIPRPNTPSSPFLPPNLSQERMGNLRPPQPHHPLHPQAQGDALGPPDHLAERVPTSADTPQRLGALGVPRAASEPEAVSSEGASVQEAPQPPETPTPSPDQIQPATPSDSEKITKATPATAEASKEKPAIPADIAAHLSAVVGDPSDPDAPLSVLKTHITLGTPDSKRRALEKLQTKIDTATRVYAADVATFVSASSDTGWPQADRSYGPRPHFHVTRPEINAPVRDLIEMATGTMPGVCEATAGPVVQTLEEHYDPEQFAQAIATAYPDLADNPEAQREVSMLKQDMQIFINGWARTAPHIDNVNLTRRLLESRFVQDHGSQRAKEMLGRRIVDLEQVFDPANPDHAQLAADTHNSIVNRQTADDYPGLAWLTRWAPDTAQKVLTELSEEYQTLRSEYMDQYAADLLGAMNPDDMTDGHRAALASLNTRIDNDSRRCVRRATTELGKTGAVSPEHLQALQRLISESPDIRIPRDAEELLCGHVPLNELDVMITQRPSLIASPSAREVAIRRFAREGDVAKAVSLARGIGIRMPEAARNLLAIYDETNDTTIAARAQDLIGRLKKAGRNPGYDSVLAQHMTAHKYGDQERIDASGREMERFLGANNEVREYHGHYERLISAHIDAGNITLAERHAQSLDKQLLRLGETNYTADSAFLQLAAAYVANGQHGAAAHIVRTYFVQQGRGSDVFMQACAILGGGQPNSRYALPVPRINALAELNRPRQWHI